MIPRAAAALRCATAFQWNNGNDCGRASAADLKFLHRLRQTHFRNFKSKSGTRIIYLLVPLLLPKFVSEGAAMYHELRKRGTSHSRRLSDRARRPPVFGNTPAGRKFLRAE